jgi:hypothetical protein
VLRTVAVMLIFGPKTLVRASAPDQVPRHTQ